MSQLKTSIYLSLILMFGVGSIAAQTRSGYLIDNFDLRNGVRIELPPLPPPPTPTPKVKGAKTVTAKVKPTVLVTPVKSPVVLPYGMQMATSQALDGYTTGDIIVDSYIVNSSRRYGIDPLLVYSLMHQESAFKRGATSYKGARGLMQLMPGTAERFGVRNIYDPEQNIEGGVKYLRFLLDMFGGDVTLTLAGYNAGEGAVLKYGRQVPPYSETQEYVRRISNRYALMRNPETARAAHQLTKQEVAQVPQQKESAPLTIYERTVFAVRLPNGKLQLVNQ